MPQSRLAATGQRVPLSPGTLLKGGAYQIAESIGQGGFSLTYLGHEGSRRLPVAIKEMFPVGCTREGLKVVPANNWDGHSFAAALESFMGEGKLLERFNHPGIVKVYALFEENSSAYLVMEFLQGESLFQGLQRRGAMNQTQALEVARQVGEALQIVHMGGLIHSDIKPENIIRTEDGRLVLLDFGVSRGYLSSKSSKAAMVAVSPGYSPPEQYDRGKALTPASDVYALSATLFHLLTQKTPPDAGRRVKGAPLPPLIELNPTISDRFWKAIEKGLRLEPETRAESVDAFLDILGALDETDGNRPTLGAKQAPAILNVVKLVELTGHQGAIFFLKLHPNGKLLVSGSKDGSVRLWSWPEGQPVGVLRAHDGPLCGLAISPDGHVLATAGVPGEVKMWSMDTGQVVKILRTGIPPVHDLAFPPDGMALAAAIADGTVQFFSPQMAQPVVLAGHSGVVNSVAFSPDGRLMATASNDAMIHLWELATPALVRILKGHGRVVQHVEFSHDSKLLTSASNDLSVKVWDVAAGLELRKFRGHGAMVFRAGFTCDPDLVVTAAADKKLRFFRLETGREFQCVEADESKVMALACDPNHPLIATGGADGKIRIWQFT